jgi:hypothetical protein
MQTQLNAQNVLGDRQQFSPGPIALRKQHLILSAIGMLSDREIRMMNRNELLDALRMAQSASPKSEATNIDTMDMPELRRVLAIVRDYFRNQVDGQTPVKTWRPQFN